jgi:hypothetical protein
MADFRGANLVRAILSDAQANEANFSGANLMFANLVGADFSGTNLTGCRVFGVSVWNLALDRAVQQDLLITDIGEPNVTVDNLEVAQFIHLLLRNERIREVIDTIGKKAVLILGRFTSQRKPILDAIRRELRQRDYLPILFDFDKPDSKDLTGTVLTLAHMVRFIIADLTDPSSVPYELAKVSEAFVPIQPILLAGAAEFAMFSDLPRRFHWVLPPCRYETQERLIAEFSERVLDPAEAKVRELRA